MKDYVARPVSVANNCSCRYLNVIGQKREDQRNRRLFQIIHIFSERHRQRRHERSTISILFVLMGQPLNEGQRGNVALTN